MITVGPVQGAAQTQAYLASVQSQVPFAMSRACNLTASAIARALRVHVASAFTLRQPNYMLKSIMVLRVADKKQGNILPPNDVGRAAEVAVAALKPGEMGAAVGLHPNPLGGSRRRDPIFQRFERGTPKTGGVAIPTTSLRPSFGDTVPRQFYPMNLGLEARRLISGGMGPSANRFGAFVLGHPGERRYGIYARVPLGGDWGDKYVRSGKRKGAIRRLKKGASPVPTKLMKLWHLKASIPIPARLQFYARAMPYLREFRGVMLVELKKAMRSARSHGLTPSNRWSDESWESASNQRAGIE